MQVDMTLVHRYALVHVHADAAFWYDPLGHSVPISTSLCLIAFSAVSLPRHCEIEAPRRCPKKVTKMIDL